MEQCAHFSKKKVHSLCIFMIYMILHRQVHELQALVLSMTVLSGKDGTSE